MKRTVFIYGAALAGLVIFLRALEYRFFVRELSIEIYVGLIAVLFTALGIWFGIKLIDKQDSKAISTGSLDDFVIDFEKLKAYGISERELDVVRLMANGLSNQEIATELYVSLHTIKTHCANLYSKLNVKRRTQAIRKAREITLAP